MIAIAGATSMLCLSIAIWCWIMAKRPRYWRQWWFVRMGRIDVGTSRDELRDQDRVFRRLMRFACMVNLMMCLSGSFWTWEMLREVHRVSTAGLG